MNSENRAMRAHFPVARSPRSTSDTPLNGCGTLREGRLVVLRAVMFRYACLLTKVTGSPVEERQLGRDDATLMTAPCKPPSCLRAHPGLWDRVRHMKSEGRGTLGGRARMLEVDACSGQGPCEADDSPPPRAWRGCPQPLRAAQRGVRPPRPLTATHKVPLATGPASCSVEAFHPFWKTIGRYFVEVEDPFNGTILVQLSQKDGLELLSSKA